MGIERELLLSGGMDILRRLMGFYNSLIIKNFQEGDRDETPASYANYNVYRRSAEGVSTFTDHSVSEEVMYRHGVPPSTVSLLNDNRQRLDTLTATSQPLQDVLSEVRIKFIEDYIDLNPYYCQLSGRPFAGERTISIITLAEEGLVNSLLDKELFDLFERNKVWYI